MSDSAESVVRNFLAAWKKSDVDELVSFISDDAVYTDGPRRIHHGIDAIKAELQSMMKMIPSTTIDIKTLVAHGGTVMTEATFSTPALAVAAVQQAKVGPDKDIPHITAPIIVKYITDLQRLGLLYRPSVVAIATW